jgi:1,4-alpha-glucan branching enzyme
MGKHAKKQVGAWLNKSGVWFRVWAPFADAVSVTGSFNDWSEQPMDKESDGHWVGFVKGAEAGQEYKYVIRNGEQTYHRNDPRALHIITSSGNSVITSTRFDWGSDKFTPPPVEQQVIYELHVGTFNRPDPAVGGTFRDVRDKLDYLAELGVNMIELMPINSMIMDRGWGYAIDYIYAIESLYGGRHEFLELVKAAHQHGIGVILDVVYNHLGPDNLDLWQFDGWHQDDKGGIYFYNDWRAETPWGNTRPDFGRPEVRQYFLDNVRLWMHDCRVDGLRADSTIFIRNAKGYNNDPATDLPEGWQFLQQLNTLVKKIKPGSLTIAEDMGENEYMVKPTKDGGAGFSAQWELGFPHSLRQTLHSNQPAEIDLTAICSQLPKRYNNDAFQRIIYSDSHDTAANGSARLYEVIAPGNTDGVFARKQAIIAAVLLLSAPGIPMLFQGQEFMQGGAFSDWEALDWQKADSHAGIVEAHKHIVALRKNSHGVSAGLTGRDINLMHVDQENKVIAYHRWSQGGPRDDVVVVINFADKAHERYDIWFPRNGVWRARFNSAWEGYAADFKDVPVPEVTVENGAGTLVLPPSSAIILSQDD